MAILTAAEYTSITGATAPNDLAAREARVVARLEAALNRRISPGPTAEELEYAPYLYGIDHDLVEYRDLYADEVAFRFGWTDAEMPAELREAVAWGINTLISPTAAVSVGLQSESVAGEYSVTYSDHGQVVGADGQAVPPALVRIADLGGRCARLAAPYRRIAL